MAPQKSISYHEAVLFVTVLPSIEPRSASFEHPYGTKEETYITISTLPTPEIRATADLRRKGDHLPLWSTGNPSLHMAVCEEWPRVKEYEIIRFHKITRAEKYNISWERSGLCSSRSRKSFLNISKNRHTSYLPQPQPPPEFKKQTSGLLIQGHHLVFSFHCLVK